MEALPPPAPFAVPLQDMNYVIRMQGCRMGISAFAYEVDARVMLNHMRIIHLHTKFVFELVDNRTGSVMYSTDEPR